MKLNTTQLDQLLGECKTPPSLTAYTASPYSASLTGHSKPDGYETSKFTSGFNLNLSF